jgi:hypothetical protein
MYEVEDQNNVAETLGRNTPIDSKQTDKKKIESLFIESV